MDVTDLDEWLRPEVEHDEVTLEVDDATTGLTLRAILVVTPSGRRVSLTVDLNGVCAHHEAEDLGPPTANWDRMHIGGVAWRMLEPLQRWELTADDPAGGIRAYFAFTGSTPCIGLDGGYEQVGTIDGQLQLADRRVTLSNALARRTHTWS